MKRCLALFILVILSLELVAQQEPLTGVYRSQLDSSVSFTILKENDHLVLKDQQQGQTRLLPLGNRQYKPEQIPGETKLEFLQEGSEPPHQFKWYQNQSYELVRSGGQQKDKVSGRYKLASYIYVVIDVSETSQAIMVRQGNHQPITLSRRAEDRFVFEKEGFTLTYQFVRNGQGDITSIKITRTGPQLFVRTALSLPYEGQDFSKRDQHGRADSLRGYLYPERACYDALFYDLQVQVNPELKTVAGYNTIRFKAAQPFTRMQVDLFANMKIDRIIYHGQPVQNTREYNAVFIRLPQAIRKGAIDSITIHYAGEPRGFYMPKLQGGFLWFQDKEGNPWIESVCQGLGASLWWPCKDHQSDKPDSMRIAITVPDTLTNISNGRLRGVTQLPNNLTRYEWYVQYPINTYNVVVNIGKYAHHSQRYNNGEDTMTLHYYYLHYNEAKAKEMFAAVPRMLGLFETHFGPYPFRKDGFTIMESLYPMEHQGAVSMGPFNNPINSDRYDTAEIRRLIWHEAAHEWWGNSVTSKDNADLWIHEAFATYAEILCYEKLNGREAALKYLRQQLPGNKEPIIGRYGVNDFHLGDMYPKGARILYMLQQIINDDDKWFSLLRGIQQHFKYKTITTEELVTYINKHTGKNFTRFFDQYLRYAALPELQLQVNNNEVKYRWNAAMKGFDMPVKIKKEGGQFEFIYPTENWQSMQAKDLVVDMDAFLVSVKRL